MKVSQKLMLGYFGMVALMGLVGYLGLSAARQTQRAFEGGGQHFRLIVVAATEAGSYAKRCEGHLMKFLMFHDEVDRKKFFQRLNSVQREIATLDKIVKLTEEKALLGKMKAHASELGPRGTALLEIHDEEMKRVGKFDPKKCAALIRQFYAAVSGVREVGVQLAVLETGFLNKQDAITAAAEVSSYAKRAEGHMFLFVTLHDPVDRKAFFKMCELLQVQLGVLEQRVRDPGGEALVRKARAQAMRLLSIGQVLLRSYDETRQSGGAWRLETHEQQIDAFHHASSTVRRCGVQLAKEAVGDVSLSRKQSVEKAGAVQRNISILVGISMVLGVVFGFAISRSISRPIQLLKNAAVEISEGRLDVSLGLHRKDEIGQLASAFDGMARELRLTTVSRDYVENIVGSMTDSLLVVDSAGEIELVNQAACEVLNYSEQELVGKRLAQIIEGDDAFSGAKLEGLVVAGSLRDRRLIYSGNSGTRIPVNLTGSVMRDAEGELAGIVCVARDMRQLDTLIEDLDCARALSQGVVQAVPSGLAVLDKSGEIVSTNPGFSKLFQEEGLERPFIEFISALAVVEAIEQAKNGKTTVLEIEADLPGGAASLAITVRGLAIEEEAEAKHQYSEREQPGRVLVVIEDVSERKRLMSELKANIEQLETTQAQLVQSGKLSAVGELAAGVAHELNNSLSAVLSYAIMFRKLYEGLGDDTRAKLGDKFPRQLGLIQTSAERCEEIVANLLAFSRQTEQEMDCVCLADVLDRTFDLIGAQFREEGGGVAIDVPSTINVRANAVQLQQVFTNIALNAIQAMQGGELSVRANLDGPGYATLEIEDTGPGIAEEHLAKTSTRSSPPSRSARGPGWDSRSFTGSSGIMGGDSGRIPAGPGNEIPDQAAPVEVSLRMNEHQLKVLVIDEEPLMDEIFRESLESQGHEVNAARSGEDALLLVRQERFDVIFLHRSTSASDSAEIVRTARTRLDSVVIILLCSHEMQDMEKVGLRIGANEVLYKLLQPTEIRAVVEGVRAPTIETVPDFPRVLAVDDDELVLELVRDILENNYKVTTTESAVEALRILKEEQHEILLTDLMMQEMNGINLIAGALNYRPSLRALVMTGYPSQEVVLVAMRGGAYDFLEKPIKPDTLIRAVERAANAPGSELLNRELCAELRQANQDLARAHAFSEKLITMMPGLVFILNPDATLRQANHQVTKVLGMTNAELSGLCLGSLLEDDFPGTRLQELVRNGELRNRKLIIKTRSGERIPIELNGSPAVLSGPSGTRLASRFVEWRLVVPSSRMTASRVG